MPVSSLTARQAEVLRFIERWIDATGFPPTRDEVAAEFGFSSVTAAKNHLLALERKGHLVLAANSARGIQLRRPKGTPAESRLPVIGRIAAGKPITAEENVDTWLVIDPDLFRPRADFLHQVYGESMIDAGICDGDLVGIHAQDTAVNGQIIAAVLIDPVTGDDSITLKRLLKTDSKIQLIAENAAAGYAPIEIGAEAFRHAGQDRPPFRIAGIYSGLIRRPR